MREISSCLFCCQEKEAGESQLSWTAVAVCVLHIHSHQKMSSMVRAVTNKEKSRHPRSNLSCDGGKNESMPPKKNDECGVECVCPSGLMVVLFYCPHLRTNTTSEETRVQLGPTFLLCLFTDIGQQGTMAR